MNYPTWQEVGMSVSVVNLLKRITPTSVPIKLINQLILNKPKKSSLTYECTKCGYRHFTFKMYEEYSQCERCFSRLICCYAKTAIKKTHEGYEDLANKIDEIVLAMKCNHSFYTNAHLDDKIIDCGWAGDKVYCKFAGGEMVRGNLPKFCIIKAALLCPYLWDLAKFNQKQENGTIFTEVIFDLIFGHYH
jgi:hypothetical protein